MNPLVHFRWYRRWRGGVWGHHSALLHPWKTWSRFAYMPADFSARLGDEDWRKTPNAAGNRLARQGQSELTGLLGPGSEARKTMDDKTLLLKAARAAGYGINQRGQSLREAELPNEPSLWLTHATWWNPLTDSGQALDLAVTLEMDIGQMLTEGHVTVTGVAFDGEALAHDVPWGTDPCAATRRAIVLVAADMAN